MDGSRRGMTLIEMTIVMVLASLICGIALPRATGFIDSIEVRGAVTEIESMFSLARHVAIARGAQSTLEIDAPSGVISLRVGTESVRSRDLRRTHGVALSSNRASMTYSPIGVGYGAANFSLVVSRNNVVDTVLISRLGRIRH